jgi:hypothetical protein
MATIKLYSVRPFNMWNIMIKAGLEFEIEEWIGRKLVSLNICMEKSVHDKKVLERAERKKAEKVVEVVDTDKKPKRKKDQ